MRLRRFPGWPADIALSSADYFGFREQFVTLRRTIRKQQVFLMNLPVCELFGERAIRKGGFAKHDDAARFLVEPMNDGELSPAWFAMAQPIINAFSGKRARCMRVHASGFVDHQHMLVFKNHARQHAAMKTGKWELTNHQNCQSPRNTTHKARRKFVMACAVIASPRRFLLMTSHWKAMAHNTPCTHS